MQSKSLFIPLFFLGIQLSAQTLEQKILLLQSENDSLRLELQKCKSAAMLGLGAVQATPKFEEQAQYTREELHRILLPKIKSKSPASYNTAIQAIAETNQFIQFCDSIKAELIARTGGMNEETGQPLGLRDKKAPTQYLIQENQGALLKLKIDLLRTVYLSSIENDPDFYAQIVLQAEPLPETSRVKSWEAYKFKDMPLAAIFPMLGKMQSDAQRSEAAVLQYLNR